MKFEDLMKNSHDQKNKDTVNFLKNDYDMNRRKKQAQVGELASKALMKSLSQALENMHSIYKIDEIFNAKSEDEALEIL